MSAYDDLHLDTTRARLRADMRVTLNPVNSLYGEMLERVLDGLVDDAMHQVEKVVAELRQAQGAAKAVATYARTLTEDT